MVLLFVRTISHSITSFLSFDFCYYMVFLVLRLSYYFVVLLFCYYMLCLLLYVVSCTSIISVSGLLWAVFLEPCFYLKQPLYL